MTKVIAAGDVYTTRHIYKNKPIFYSLGNFISQIDTVAEQPAEAYERSRLQGDALIGELTEKKTAGGTKGFATIPSTWFSVLPSWTFEDGKISDITLYPIDLDQKLSLGRRGLPRLVNNNSILEYLQDLCKLHNTEIEIKDGKGIIHLQH